MTAPTAPSPGLGEREAVARTFKRLLCKGACLTPETCAMCIPKAKNVADVFVAEHIEPLRTENETLRAERDAASEDAEEQRGIAEERGENLRVIDAISDLIGLPHDVELEPHHVQDALAERDAVIARAEEAERGLEKEGEALELEIELHGEASADLSTALATVSDLTAKLAQAEGEIATMRRDASKVMAPFAACVFNDNFDVTLSTGRLADRDWVDLERFHRTLTKSEPPHGD